MHEIKHIKYGSSVQEKTEELQINACRNNWNSKWKIKKKSSAQEA